MCHGLEFHFAEAEGEAECDETAGGLPFTIGDKEGVVVACCPSVLVEDVVDVEVDGQLAVKEICIDTEVDALVRLVGGEDALGGAAVVGIDEELVVLPKLSPSVEAETVAPDRIQERLTAEGEVLVVISEGTREPDIDERGGSVGDIEVEAGGVGVADVHWLGVADHGSVEIAEDDIGKFALLVGVGAIVKFGADRAKLHEVLIPLELNVLIVRGNQIGVTPRAEAVNLIHLVKGEGGEPRLADTAGEAEAEIVHRLGAVAEVEGRSQRPEDGIGVVAGDIIIDEMLVVHIAAEADFGGKIAEAALIGGIE